MIIKKIQLRNIRSHTSTELEFDKGISVFTGRTGSGKSTVIMAIQYALFGSNARIPNNELLRRRSKTGHVRIEFEHQENRYVIVRGLKTQGDKVMVDTSNLDLLKDGKKIPLLGRAKDLDEKILEILGYPDGVDPVKLFEVTTYSKQDEIRNLIEMKPKERQEYIDKLLQIQKYENTWDKMKDVILSLETDVRVVEERIKAEDMVKEQMKESEKKLGELQSEIESSKNNLVAEKSSLEKVEIELKEQKEKFEDILKSRSSYESFNSELKSKSEEIRKLDIEIKSLKQKIESFEKDIPDAPDTESLISKRAEIMSNIENENRKIKDLSRKNQDVKSLKGECPLCGSKITEEHKSEVEEIYGSMISESQSAIMDYQTELERIERVLPKAKRRDEILKSFESDRRILNEKIPRADEMKSRIKELEVKLSGLELVVKGYETMKKKIDDLQRKNNEISSKVSSLQTEIKSFESQARDETERIAELKDQLIDFENIKENLKSKKAAIEILNRLRQDIRSIREKVRMRFLNDFKIEFQRKFEEIRKYEEEYSVDIKVDYEPIAYSGGEEVAITTLSGGEKTSVALSYRLALADIAAQIGGIQESELLMLDEPTTGFDEDDIKALPEALANLRTIPQIIIVTHAEELKETADYKFEVKKEGRISKVELLGI
jgi:exonuclease SbcC